MRSLIIALLLTSAVHAQGFSPSKPIGDHDKNYNVGRMPELPTGPNKLDCWIVVSDQWQSNSLEYALAQAIATDPRMQQIKAGTYFNYYTVSTPKFRNSGLIQAVGTATPILCVMQHDGAIKSDGSGGLLVNAKSCPQSVPEIVDMLCDAIGALNPPPKFEGQTTEPQIVREASVDQCPDGNCPPAPAFVPNLDGTLPSIRPSSRFPYGAIGLGVLGFCGLAAAGVVFAIHRGTRVQV